MGKVTRKFRTCPAGQLKFCRWRNSIVLSHLASSKHRCHPLMLCCIHHYSYGAPSHACLHALFQSSCLVHVELASAPPSSSQLLIPDEFGVSVLGSQLWDVAHIDMLSSSLDSVRSCLMSDWPWHALHSHFGCWGDWVLSLY